MAKDTTKPQPKTRRAELRRVFAQRRALWSDISESRAAAWNALVWTCFGLLAAVIVYLSQGHSGASEDRVMRETRVTSAPFEIKDQAATDLAREAARRAEPRVYAANVALLDEIRSSLDGLPRALVDADTLEAVDPSIREVFALNEDRLDAVRAQAASPTAEARWSRAVDRFVNEVLLRRPILRAQEYQRENQATGQRIELRIERPDQARASYAVFKEAALNAEGVQLEGELRDVIHAGRYFTGPLADVVVSRVLADASPTFTFDGDATRRAQSEAAQAVPTEVARYEPGHVIYQRGDKLTAAQEALLRAAVTAERERMGAWRTFLARAGAIGVVSVATVSLAIYIALFCPRIGGSAPRVAVIAGMMLAALGAGVWIGRADASLAPLALTGSSLIIASLLAIAYDQRIAAAFGAMEGFLVAIALGLPLSSVALVIIGVGAMVWRLREVRDRNAMLRAGVTAGAALFLGGIAVGLAGMPPTGDAFAQVVRDAGLAGASGVAVAAMSLFVLPAVERGFDIITGAKLIELRDPQHPLLRLLQQRAPGTYNHSLNVATLGEAAASAIDADPLLTYAGALYHDIGKLNKPAYFVENQTPGLNPHDKLTPAMSLLIIVGHVKDGIELAKAKEFALPRPLLHFIEAHHGTTLVEYFYQRAQERADADAEQSGVESSAVSRPTEFEYRYPGPCPQTKEVAIIMLCDAVESAARTLTDPTPSRIDQLVRSIANRRLTDGQFDDCNLTLRELNTVVETVSKSLTSIYHGRIAYASTSAPKQSEPKAELEQPEAAPPPTNNRGQASAGVAERSTAAT